ncbi:hypothetical protein MRX96_056543 [Rhipicephalus microplus]
MQAGASRMRDFCGRVKRQPEDEREKRRCRWQSGAAENNNPLALSVSLRAACTRVGLAARSHTQTHTTMTSAFRRRLVSCETSEPGPLLAPSCSGNEPSCFAVWNLLVSERDTATDPWLPVRHCTVSWLHSRQFYTAGRLEGR